MEINFTNKSLQNNQEQLTTIKEREVRPKTKVDEFLINQITILNNKKDLTYEEILEQNVLLKNEDST